MIVGIRNGVWYKVGYTHTHICSYIHICTYVCMCVFRERERKAKRVGGKEGREGNRREGKEGGE